MDDFRFDVFVYFLRGTGLLRRGENKDDIVGEEQTTICQSSSDFWMWPGVCFLILGCSNHFSSTTSKNLREANIRQVLRSSLFGRKKHIRRCEGYSGIHGP